MPQATTPERNEKFIGTLNAVNVKGSPETFSKSRSTWWKVHENKWRKREAEDFGSHIAMIQRALLVFGFVEDANRSLELETRVDLMDFRGLRFVTFSPGCRIVRIDR